MNKNNIKEMVGNICEYIEELVEKDELNQVEYGELLGYTSALAVIKSACMGYDLSEIGLDFDIDEKYLSNI